MALIHWGTPLMADIEPTLDHLRRVRREVGPPIAVCFVPADAAPPAPEVAKEMARRLPEMAALCIRVHQVFDGSGFFVGFKRSVLTGMLLATNKLSAPHRRVAVSVHASIEEVAETLSPDQQVDLMTLVATVRAA